MRREFASNPGAHCDVWREGSCPVLDTTLIPFNSLDKVGQTGAQFEKGEKSVDEYKCCHSNPGQPLPSLGRRLQIFEMSDARVGGELPQTRKQMTVNQATWDKDMGGKGMQKR